MTGFQNRLLNITQERKQILEDLEADEHCKMSKEDLTNLIHEDRRIKI
jgi:hypothetical protein